MALLKFLRGSKSRRGHGEFKDAAAARVWVQGLGHPGSTEMLAGIAEYLRESRADRIAPLVRLQVLDPLRVAVCAALKEHRDQDEARSLPLSASDGGHLWDLIDTAGLLRDCYRDLVDGLKDATPGPQDDRPQVTALHRALDLHAQILLLFLLLRVAVDESDWDLHCQLGQKVRDLDVQDVARPDSSNATLGTTCREAFVAPVYLALADTAVMNRLELQLVASFVRRYCGRVGFRIDALASVPRPGGRPPINPGPVVRLAGWQVRFDSQRVYVSLEKRSAALEQGGTPAQVGFGDRLSVAGSRNLMGRMMRVWGAVHVDDIDTPEGRWEASEFPELQALLGNSGGGAEGSKKKPMPAQAVNVYSYNKVRRDGLSVTPVAAEKNRLSEMLATAETWRVEGEQDELLRCQRRQPRPRVAIGQLVVLKPGGIKSQAPLRFGYIEGMQQLLQKDDEERLRPALAHDLRVRLLPGLPVRVGVAADGNEFDRPFLVLDGNPLDNAAIPLEELATYIYTNSRRCSLLLPLASFRPGREMRMVAGGRAIKILCAELVWRGLDFDQFRFDLMP